MRKIFVRSIWGEYSFLNLCPNLEFKISSFLLESIDLDQKLKKKK